EQELGHVLPSEVEFRVAARPVLDTTGSAGSSVSVVEDCREANMSLEYPVGKDGRSPVQVCYGGARRAEGERMKAGESMSSDAPPNLVPNFRCLLFHKARRQLPKRLV